MPEYRRAYAPGGTLFFTLVTEGRTPLFADPLARSLLRRAIVDTRSRFPFTMEAIVLLPDHLHTIWTLPDNDPDFSTRWSFLKRSFSKAWVSRGGRQQRTTSSRRRNRRLGIWQRRFWEHTIRDDRDYERHCDYIHYNPVKRGLAACPHDWPCSSFSQFVRRNIYPAHWHCACVRPDNTAPDFHDIADTAIE